MKTLKKSKLALKSETLRSLNPSSLGRAAGGTYDQWSTIIVYPGDPTLTDDTKYAWTTIVIKPPTSK